MAVLFLVLAVLIVGGGILLKRIFPTAPTPRLVLAGVSLLGIALLGLTQFLLLVFFLTAIALLGIAAVFLRGDRERRVPYVRECVRNDLADLTTLTDFAETLAAVQARCALTAHRQGHGMAEELETVMARLAARGALTPEVRTELVQLTQSHLARVHTLAEDMQALLVQLAGRYDPAAAPRLWLRLQKARWQRRVSV